jgi:adenylate cyclase
MFHLTIVRPDGHEVEQGFSHDKIIVGRHDKCDLRLVDSLISRNHCLIFREGDRYLVKDLASRNGTWLNGRKVKNRGTIKRGDAIQVGPFRIIFEPGVPTADSRQVRTLDMRGTEREPFMHKDEAEQVVKPLGMISSYLSEASRVRQRPKKARRERLNRNLLTIYKITEELVVKEDLDQILERIMDLLFDTFDPSQAAILLREGSGPPLPKKERCAEGTGNARAVSNTIINRVLTDRVGIITDNALEDPRFDSGDSVIIDGIRSVMAAPIWEDQSILGVLYLDSLDFINGYQSEDLDLLTAIGHQTALAIQRHNLTEMLKEEAVKSAVIRENLGRFHSPAVVDLILKGAADLEVKETLATIFFCDVVHFTSLCESCTPKQLQNLLNVFCKTVSEVIFQEQGTLDKFIGDAALTIFGAPLPQEDAPLRAVRAALKIREQLNKARRTIPPELHFQVRYGIDSGNAVVGNFGSDERMDYTILGHAVNLASRISKAAAPDQILIGAETFAGIQESKLFKIKSVGRRRLKGVKGTMKLFEVQGFL